MPPKAAERKFSPLVPPSSGQTFFPPQRAKKPLPPPKKNCPDPPTDGRPLAHVWLKLNINMDAHLEDEKRQESFDPITASLRPCLQTITLQTLLHCLRASLSLTSFHVLNLSGSHALPLSSTLHTGSSLLYRSKRRRKRCHRPPSFEAAMEGSLFSILLRYVFPKILYSRDTHSQILKLQSLHAERVFFA